MIKQTIERIKEQVPALKIVAGITEFSQVGDRSPAATPACYVLTLDEDASPGALANVVMQRVNAAVGIVLVVRNVSDSTGAAAALDMQGLRELVKDQVYGWAPADGFDPYERSRSGILAFRDGCIWWQDIYTTSYIDRSKQ